MKIQFVIFIIILGDSLTLGQYDFLFGEVDMTWDNAVKYCRGQGRELLKIDSVEINLVVKYYAKEKGIKYYWVNANDKAEEKKFVYLDNTPITYADWILGKPDGVFGQDCAYAHYNFDYQWDDWACDSGACSVICSEVAKVQYEFIVSPKSFTYDDAVNYCRERKRHLVRIENLEKNTRVANYVKSVGRIYYWIDANDKAEEGKFVNSDNRSIEFYNWRPEFPRGGVVDNCVEAFEYINYKWMDTKCGDISWVICDKRNCSQGNYESTAEKMTYNDAVRFCDKNHMDMVVTADAATNEKVFEYARSKNLGTYWINGNDIANESVWVDMYGDKLNFTNWESAQPNGQNIENCIVAGYSATAVWYDELCETKHSVICQTCQLT